MPALAARLREEGIGTMKVRDSNRDSMRRRRASAAVLLPFVLMILWSSWWGSPGALAAPSPTPPQESGNAPEVQPVPDGMPNFGDPDTEAVGGGNHFVAEIIDTVYTVGPATFFALDLPGDPAGARALHLSGTANVTDRKGDIMVRLFRTPDYQAWLKKRGGEKAGPLWTSKKSRNVTIDHDLKGLGPCVVLLDNGYSMRTAKHVRIQLQIQYQRTGSGSNASSAAPAAQPVDDLVTPRANVEEEIPPPPPPPPDEGSK